MSHIIGRARPKRRGRLILELVYDARSHRAAASRAVVASSRRYAAAGTSTGPAAPLDLTLPVAPRTPALRPVALAVDAADGF